MFDLKPAWGIALLALSCVAPAVHAEEPGKQERKPESCLGLAHIRSTDILDKQHIVFVMNDGSKYLNTLPYPCPGLSHHTAYMHRTSLSEICDLDVITLLNPIGGGYMPGASCGLGKFVPVEESDIGAMKKQIGEHGAVATP